MSTGPWLTSEKAAEYLGLTTKALREATRRGKIPVHRLGRLLRFSAAELDALVSPCPTSTATSDGAGASGR